MTTWFYPGQEDYITKLNELGAIAELVAGQDGWSPTFAVAADGTRSVLQVVDWIGGEGTKPVTGKYVGAAGFVTLIADAVDIRGLKGDKGDKGDEGDAGPANSLNIGTVVSGASASATISGTAPTQELNLVLPKGDNGLNGLNGWSPVLAVATDGERRVLEVVDWIGGEGTKPAITGFIGATGIVATAALAVDIRGSIGATGPSNTLAIGTVTSAASPSATITGTSPNQTLNLVLPKGDKGDTGNTGPANTLTIGTVSTGAASATITGTAPSQVLNLVLPKATDGADGTNGDDGWSPIFAVVADGERRVLQLVDWTGGTGIKPGTGAYVGSTGLVALVADATDIRGAKGAAGSGTGDVVGPAASVDNEVALFDGATGKAIKGGGVLNTGAYSEEDRWKLQGFYVTAVVAGDGSPTWALGSYYPQSNQVVVNGHTAIIGLTGDIYTMIGGVWVLTDPFGANLNGSRIAFTQNGDLGPFLWTRTGGVTTRAPMLQGSGNIRYSEGTAGVDFVSYSVRSKLNEIGRLINLITADKSSIVAAINELVSSKANVSALGTSAALNVPATGDAATGEVVKGDDTRLSDSRPPTGTAGGVLSGSYPNPGFAVDMATQAELDAVSSVANAKLSDAPSDGKTYGRKDAAWAEVVSGGGTGYATGDVVVTVRTLSTPDYVLSDTVYLQSSYPDLFAIVGTLGDGGATKTKLPNPSTLPAANALDCSWDASGKYLAVVNDTVSPYLIVYERSGSTLSKLSDPATMPVSCYACAWSPDGGFLAVGSAVSPYLHIYQRSGSTLTKITDPSSMPTDKVNGISWSADGKYLALGLQSSPYIAVYERSGTTFTKLADPASLPGSTSQAISCDASGSYIAVASVLSPFMAVYERAGSTLTKLSNPATLPASQGNACAWSPSGEFLAVGHNSSPFVSIYQRVGATLTKLANPASLPAAAIYGCAWDSTGQYLALGTQITPFITVYQRGGTTFTKLANPSTLPTGFGRGVSWAASGGYLAVAHTTTPFITAYSSFPYDPTTHFQTPRVAPLQQLPIKTYIKA